jgi:hypothetical protein
MTYFRQLSSVPRRGTFLDHRQYFIDQPVADASDFAEALREAAADVKTRRSNLDDFNLDLTDESI